MDNIRMGRFDATTYSESTHVQGQTMLIVFSGLPGTGKTTIAQELVSASGSCI